MIEADIIITDLMGGDISIHFVTKEFYNQFMWSLEEVALSKSENRTDQWKAEKLHKQRIEEIPFHDDNGQLLPGILKVVYSQIYTNGEDINMEFKIGRIMNLESS